MMSDDVKASKGLEFPVVAPTGVGHMFAKGEDEKAAPAVYVAATRATRRLVIGVGGDGDGGFGKRFPMPQQ